MSKTSEPQLPSDHIPLRPIRDFISAQDPRDRHFFIPSYQRGYRWEPKEVKALLDDIKEFVLEQSLSQDVRRPYYCLQPIVVKPRDIDGVAYWEVIDGQQRLTTLWFILNELKKGTDDYADDELFTITYQTRPNLNLDNISPRQDIDSFYMNRTKDTVRSWIASRRRLKDVALSDIRKCLFVSADTGSVKIIWYEDNNREEIDAIKTFNSINKGKIGLTSSELVKALFLLYYDNDNVMSHEVATEWYRMEKELQDPSFWSFLANADYQPDTHIDLLLDLMTNRSPEDDSDYVYKRFQALFDDTTGEEKIVGVDKTRIWAELKRIFGVLVFWYQEPEIYHYVGYVVAIGTPLSEIYNSTQGLRKDEIASTLKNIIRDKLSLNADSLRQLSYASPKTWPTLLLFNVLTSASMGSGRFDFLAFKQVYKKRYTYHKEHIASKTDNSLTRNEDKLLWLGSLESLTRYVASSKLKIWQSLLSQAKEIAKDIEGKKESAQESFKRIYAEVVGIVEAGSIDEGDKDNISNLALLDSHLNQSYGNALFPTKRQRIIQSDKMGNFIPPATRNAFLKYYSDKDTNSTHWDTIWNQDDATAYLDQMVTTLSDGFLL
ncbi:MAG: DUF262 domain-containing protein [Bacteroidales bacterium]|nr:DUF262 domain-containing protein [Bacteroidales bacterium]